MSGNLRLTDELLHDMFERRARRGSVAGLRGSVLTATRTASQRGRWTVRAGGTARPPLRLLAVAILLVGVAGGGLLVVARQPTPPPTLHYRHFSPPFDYRPVLGVATDAPVSLGSIIGFTSGGDDLYPRDEDATFLPGAHGIAIARIATPVSHGCAGPRVPTRTDPEGFIADMKAMSGAGIGPSTLITFDGRPALQVDVDPDRATCPYADVHTYGTGIGSDYVLLNIPSRLIVTEVDGVTVMLQAWAPTAEEFAAWLPTATTFMDGVNFSGGP